MSETAEAVKMSARVLGQQHGLTSQEMNWAFKLAGLLDRVPNAWGLTEKAAPYAAEQFGHRGTGGYSWYNRTWDERTWNPAVIREMDLSEAGKRRIRQAASDWRLAKKAVRAAEAAYPSVIPVAIDNAAADPEALAKVVLPLIAVAGAYTLYKTVPVVRRRWNERRGAPERAATAGPAPRA